MTLARQQRAHARLGLHERETEEERLRHIIHDALRQLDWEAQVQQEPRFAETARAILRSGERS